MGVASREHSTVVVKLPPKGEDAPLTVMERQAEQREHRIVDLIRVDLHAS